MTALDVLNKIKQYSAIVARMNGRTLNIKMIQIIVDALEKQIAKQPIDDRYPWSICPACGGSVNLENVIEYIQNKEQSHCEHCGQKLDWSV